jgi:SAM-dependent methyltransferase
MPTLEPRTGSLPAGLRCPSCHANIAADAGESLVCAGCGTKYPVVGGVPVLINEANSVFTTEEVIRAGPYAFDPASAKTGIVQRIRDSIPSSSANYVGTRLVNDLHALLTNEHARPRILIIGGGVIGRGIQAMVDDPSVELVESDIFIGPRTGVLFDSHDVPFEDESFDAVISQAVLEHVLDPFRCDDEFYRVLRPDGIVYASTSFMQQVHGGRHDFMRFSLSGHRYLFRRFVELDSGVAVGPGSALAWSWKYFLGSFARTVKQRQLANLLGRLTGFYWKYFDKVLHTRPAAADAASSVYFLGRKAPEGWMLSPREILNSYVGMAPD